MLCHIHPPPGRSSRHRTAGLTDSRRDSRGAFCNSFTGDAFSGTLRFILAGRGTAGQSRRCEMAARMRRYPRHESARYGCLAETSRIFLPSRSGFKLTKISCDIGATPARIRLIRLRIGRQQALRGLSSTSKRGEPFSPSRQRSRRNTQLLRRWSSPSPGRRKFGARVGRNDHYLPCPDSCPTNHATEMRHRSSSLNFPQNMIA